MDENRGDRDRTSPLDDLGPALRRAVEGVVRRPVPEDLTDRALASARRARMPRPDAEEAAQTAAWRWRPRTAWPVWALAASIALVAVLVWWHGRGLPDRHVVIKSPTTTIGPGDTQPVPPALPPHPRKPQAPPGDRLPTLWAYRQAVGQSAGALEAMLDEDARRLLRNQPQPLDKGASLRFVPETL